MLCLQPGRVQARLSSDVFFPVVPWLIPTPGSREVSLLCALGQALSPARTGLFQLNPRAIAWISMAGETVLGYRECSWVCEWQGKQRGQEGACAGLGPD